MGHDTLGVDGKYRRYGDAIPWRVLGKGLVDQIEGADDFSLLVR